MRSFDFLGSDISDTKVKIEYLHNGQNSMSSAFEINECATVRLLLPRKLGVVSVFIEIFNEAEDTLILKNALDWCDLIDGYDAYEYEINSDALGCGLFFFTLSIV